DLTVKAVEKYGSLSKASDATAISESKLKKYHGMRELSKEVRDKISSPGTSKPPVEILRKIAQLPKPTQVGAYEAVKAKTRSQAEGILAKIRDKIADTTVKEICEDTEPIPLQETNVWFFLRSDERFGSSHPMRLAGQVVQNLLYLYTSKGDVVLDPMAGFGTTIDVCKSMGRQCIAYDLIPLRPDIEQNDITKGIPLDNASVDFILLDPPYGDMKKGYSNNEHDLANMSHKDFLESIEKIRDECYRVLREGGHVAFLMAPRKLSKNELIPLTSEVLGIFRERFGPVERIVLVKDIHSKQAPGFNVQKWRAKEYKYLLRGFVDLVVMEKKPTG
ncbi:MAG: site-specific DNA-methyltransferase, partial [Candidatus Bathyarchaeota archaeon]|nr:site-specific DNA-methyltransferase [Candidatus Bathyarchaeota archaeon]